MNRKEFLEQLMREIAAWPGLGLASAEQIDRLREHYAAEAGPVQPPVPVRHGMRLRLPAILIGLAAVLIGLGLILFYSANWAAMTPTVRLIQVFAALVLIQGGAFFLYFIRPHPLAARGLFLLGIFAFGAAIGLVAQIYHISAHPTNGILLWLIVTLLLSALMLERVGVYAALVLALIWFLWERTVYNDAAPLYLLFAIAVGALFWKVRDRIGLLLAFLTLPLYALINLGYLEKPLLMVISLGAAGALLLALGRAPGDQTTAPSQAAARLLGWFFAALPAFGLAWPFEMDEGFAVAMREPPHHHAFFVACWLSAFLLSFWEFRRSGQRPLSIWLALLLAIFPLTFPFHNQPVLVTVMHLALLVFLAGGLFAAYHEGAARTSDRIAMLLLALGALITKAIGLFALAVESAFDSGDEPDYYVAYLMGFLLFAAVVFLINELVAGAIAYFDAERGERYPRAVLRAATGLGAFLFLYAVSFDVGPQNSIYSAGETVLTLLALFVVVALPLFGAAFLRLPERLPALMAFGVFALALIMLLATNPQTPPWVYQVIFNLMLLALVILALLYSVRINSAALANIAIAGFALHAGTRVIDTFWDLLSGALLFIVCGILLFALGLVLERQRRRLLAHIEEATDE